MRRDEWFKPLLVILFLVAAVSITALAWFGLTLLGQESTVQAQHALESLEERSKMFLRSLLVLVFAVAVSHGQTLSPERRRVSG